MNELTARNRKVRTWFSVIGVIALACMTIGLSAYFGRARLDASRMNSSQLLTAASAAHSAGQDENAGFLFFAGQARFQVDKQVYPPVQSGADSPGVLTSALSATLGPPILRKIESNPAAFAEVVDRLRNWSPTFDAQYDPGWEYRDPLPLRDAEAIVATTMQEVLTPLQRKAQLFADDEYARLAQVVDDANAVERRFWIVAQEGGGVDAVPQELQSEFAEAQGVRGAAAIRMREIEWNLDPEMRWHQRIGWKAEDFFNDELVIALCRAIELNDVAEMERLIADGANVNQVGKQGMTPLLWAFPDRKLERFACLLGHGADPNVYIESDFGVASHVGFHPYPRGGHSFLDRGCHAGQSVVLLAARSPVIDYLELVMAHGGDANQVDRATGVAPLDIVLDRHIPDTQPRVELLVARSADVNRYCEYTQTFPVMRAVDQGKLDTAMYLLEAGADYTLYQPDGLEKLIHVVVRNAERSAESLSTETKQKYQALLDWLTDHGESIGQARQDLARWRSWTSTNDQRRRNREAEIAARKAEEQAKENRRSPEESSDEDRASE